MAVYKTNPYIWYTLFERTEMLNRDVWGICIRMEVGYAVKSFIQGLNRKFNIRYQAEMQIFYSLGALYNPAEW